MDFPMSWRSVFRVTCWGWVGLCFVMIAVNLILLKVYASYSIFPSQHPKEQTIPTGNRFSSSAAKDAVKRMSMQGCGKNITLRNIPVQELSRGSTLGLWPKYLHGFKNPCWYRIVSDLNGLKCLPYFHIIGVGKSGSTSLYNSVIKHPDVLPPNQKEGIYFNERTNGPGEFLKYLEGFSRAREAIYDSGYARGYHGAVTLDANPITFVSAGQRWPKSGNGQPKCTMAHTLYSVNVNAKLLVILRDPTNRLLSHYRHSALRHQEHVSGEYFTKQSVEAIALWNRCLAKRNLLSCAFDYPIFKEFIGMQVMLTQSLYYPYAKEWLSVFPRDQVMFIKSEEFYADAVTVMKEVFDFLDLEAAPDHVLDDIGVEMANWRQREAELDKTGTSYKRQLSNDTRKLLDGFFAPYNKQLSQLLGDDKWLFK